MINKPNRLGRGLDALMKPNNIDMADKVDYSNYEQNNQAQMKNENETNAKIPISLIEPNPFQPRLSFEPGALDELKQSIIANGLIQPITVRKYKDKYQLISGERRLRACTDIGFKDIPAYIMAVDSDEKMLAMALIENIQRERLNPIEVGLAYKRLMDECSLTQEQIAEKVGKDRSTIANSIRLLKLPKEIQDHLISEDISMGHARALINLSSEKLQIEALKKIIEQNLSVRKVEQLVKKMLLDDKNVKAIKKSGNSQNFVVSAGIRDIEDRLRRIFATKVQCKQKNDGSGEITIEFYSNDDLERLFELFDATEKYYS